MLDLNDTWMLVLAVERIKMPASFLVDTFFPNIPATARTNHIAVEYRKKGRRLAPFITRGMGINMEFATSKVDVYTPPMMAPAVNITPEMLKARSYGENVHSTLTEDKRAEQLQVESFLELQNMIINRKNKMAADILTTGKCEIEGYGDDAKLKVLDTVSFDWDQKVTPSKAWSDASASILGDIQNASMLIQENAGLVPDVMVVGKNVFNYMLDNEEIGKILAIPNRDNFAMFNFAPTTTAPQVMYCGKIASLGLDVYTYAETYTDETGKAKPFIPDDGVVIGVSGRGQQLHAAITLLNQDETAYETFVTPYVPYLIGDKKAQQLQLAMYSRCVLAPQFSDDWAYINAKGE